MNIIAMTGSPHGTNGNTGRLLDEVIAGVEVAGASIEIISSGRNDDASLAL